MSFLAENFWAEQNRAESSWAENYMGRMVDWAENYFREISIFAVRF
jgi:hypothetical protein